jgi:hypothetical protein
MNSFKITCGLNVYSRFTSPWQLIKHSRTLHHGRKLLRSTEGGIKNLKNVLIQHAWKTNIWSTCSSTIFWTNVRGLGFFLQNKKIQLVKNQHKIISTSMSITSADVTMIHHPTNYSIQWTYHTYYYGEAKAAYATTSAIHVKIHNL